MERKTNERGFRKRKKERAPERPCCSTNYRRLLGYWTRSGPAHRDGIWATEDETEKGLSVPKRGRIEHACSRPNSITAADTRGGRV